MVCLVIDSQNLTAALVTKIQQIGSIDECASSMFCACIDFQSHLTFDKAVPSELTVTCTSRQTVYGAEIVCENIKLAEIYSRTGYLKTVHSEVIMGDEENAEQSSSSICTLFLNFILYQPVNYIKCRLVKANNNIPINIFHVHLFTSCPTDRKRSGAAEQMLHSSNRSVENSSAALSAMPMSLNMLSHLSSSGLFSASPQQYGSLPPHPYPVPTCSPAPTMPTFNSPMHTFPERESYASHPNLYGYENVLNDTKPSHENEGNTQRSSKPEMSPLKELSAESQFPVVSKEENSVSYQSSATQTDTVETSKMNKYDLNQVITPEELQNKLNDLEARLTSKLDENAVNIFERLENLATKIETLNISLHAYPQPRTQISGSALSFEEEFAQQLSMTVLDEAKQDLLKTSCPNLQIFELGNNG